MAKPLESLRAAGLSAVIRAALAALILSVFVGVNIFLLFSPRYINLQYSRLQTTAIHNNSIAKHSAHLVVKYLRHRTNRLPDMSTSEKRHLSDVRTLVNRALVWAKIAFFSLAVIVLVLYRTASRRQFWGHLLVAGALGIFGLGLIAVFGALNFDWAFDRFHRLFFPYGTWLFAADSVLIRLFPLDFWISAARDMAALVVVELFLFELFVGANFYLSRNQTFR